MTYQDDDYTEPDPEREGQDRYIRDLDDDEDTVAYCANCDAPFSPEESGYDDVCCEACHTKNEARIAAGTA